MAPDPSDEKAVRAYIAPQLARVIGFAGEARAVTYKGPIENAEISGPVVKRNLYGTELPTWCVRYSIKLTPGSHGFFDRNTAYDFNWRKDEEGRWYAVRNPGGRCDTPYTPFPELERERAAILPTS